jgi:sugar lactone lactonase YvrE
MIGYADRERPALDARIGGPESIAFDASGRLYFSDWGEVRAIDASGVLKLVLPMQADSVISSIAFDASGNLYVAYPQDHRVRKVTSKGVVTIFAGNGRQDTSGDGGPATAASLNHPLALAFDRSGYLYIAESFDVRKVSPSGIITRVAGGGERFEENAPATSARMNPFGMTVEPSGAVLIADESRVRRVTTDGRINTVAGTLGDTEETRSPFGLITGLAVDPVGNILVSHQNGRLDRIGPTGAIATVAGGGANVYAHAVPATEAEVSPAGIPVDDAGSVLLLDYGAVRKVTRDGNIRFVALTWFYSLGADLPPKCLWRFLTPDLFFGQGVTADPAGHLWVSDTSAGAIIRIAQLPATPPPGRRVGRR